MFEMIFSFRLVFGFMMLLLLFLIVVVKKVLNIWVLIFFGMLVLLFLKFMIMCFFLGLVLILILWLVIFVCFIDFIEFVRKFSSIVLSLLVCMGIVCRCGGLMFIMNLICCFVIYLENWLVKCWIELRIDWVCSLWFLVFEVRLEM